ncbi:RNA polymerase sigma factor [Carnobacteriaceae bacterium 52-44]
MKSDAMDRIYKKYHKELYLYALSLCREEEMAQDLVSETFFRAFIASNQPGGPFKYWLFRILKNHYIDQIRKKQEPLTLGIHKAFIMDKKLPDPSSHYIQKERNERLFQHLINLEPIIYREVIYLYYYAEMNIRDISKTIHRSETNTKTILYRARKKLGRHLKEDTYDFQR